MLTRSEAEGVQIGFMPRYKICVPTEVERVCFAEFYAADDIAALEEAECRVHMPELWSGDRLVACPSEDGNVGAQAANFSSDPLLFWFKVANSHHSSSTLEPT